MQAAKFTFLEVITEQGLSHLKNKISLIWFNIIKYNLKIIVNITNCCILILQYNFSWDLFPVQWSALSFFKTASKIVPKIYREV